MQDPEIWSDQDKAQNLLKQQKAFQLKLEKFSAITTAYEELQLMVQMAMEEQDDSLELDFSEGLVNLKQLLYKGKLDALLNGEYDGNSAILTIHAGSGGLDATDWAEMLLRMYLRWGERRGFKTTLLDLQREAAAGIKSATIHFDGGYGYGYLKSEKGVHRIVRISPYDASGKRHTSFASVDVMPELPDDVEIDINPADLKVDTYRATGAGGQHINTTDSAVRITHVPTGVIVQCQSERSQIKNRSTAMKMLMAKLIELKIQENKDKIEDLKGDYAQITWGSQIRSYVFHPYQMVKDHRTSYEVGNVNNVMDGDLDDFMDAYLRYMSQAYTMPSEN